MNVGLLSRIPWLPLMFLWLSYALLGWYLSFYHIFWFVGAFVAALGLTLSRNNITALERLFKLTSKGLLVISVMLLVCILLVLAATWSILVPIIVMPLAITLLANIEMRFADFSRINTVLILTVLAGLGLGFGEIIDLLFLSSSHNY